MSHHSPAPQSEARLLAALPEEARRCRAIAAIRDLAELDGYEIEARRRGLQPYEVTALATCRQKLERKA